MIKSLLRKLTRRELTDKLKDAAKRLQSGEKVELPTGYYFNNGKITRNVWSDSHNTSTEYRYDKDGLLMAKTEAGYVNLITVQYEPHGSFTGKKEGARLNTLQRAGITASIIGAGSIAIIAHSTAPPTIEPRSWQEYKAQLGEYSVDINLNCEGETCQNITHLNQKTKTGGVAPSISGHDYNLDGVWDRIFFCDIPAPGCNSFAFSEGKLAFEPNWHAKQEGGMKMFKPEDIVRARNFLNQAQAYVTEENRVQNWSAEVRID